MTWYWWTHWFWITGVLGVAILIQRIETYPLNPPSFSDNIKESKSYDKNYKKEDLPIKYPLGEIKLDSDIDDVFSGGISIPLNEDILRNIVHRDTEITEDKKNTVKSEDNSKINVKQSSNIPEITDNRNSSAGIRKNTTETINDNKNINSSSSNNNNDTTRKINDTVIQNGDTKQFVPADENRENFVIDYTKESLLNGSSVENKTKAESIHDSILNSNESNNNFSLINVKTSAEKILNNSKLQENASFPSEDNSKATIENTNRNHSTSRGIKSEKFGNQSTLLHVIPMSLPLPPPEIGENISGKHNSEANVENNINATTISVVETVDSSTSISDANSVIKTINKDKDDIDEDNEDEEDLQTIFHMTRQHALDNITQEEEIIRAGIEKHLGGERARKSKVLAEYRHELKFINFTSDTKNLLARSAAAVSLDFDDPDDENISSEALSIQRAYVLDAGAISGICLAVLGLCCGVGLTGVVLYKRRYLNKPQTLSEPDSSGYIDDSTIRDNSDEMYSLDNDSFLNSLEAMTIQNYWTDTVKHTKL